MWPIGLAAHNFTHPLHIHTTSTTSFRSPLITPVHIRRESHAHPQWPNHVVLGQLQPGLNFSFPLPSQVIDHCWHISNWAGIDKSQQTRLQGPDTAEKPRTNIQTLYVCFQKKVHFTLLLLVFLFFYHSVCLIPDRTLVWATADITVVQVQACVKDI